MDSGKTGVTPRSGFAWFGGAGLHPGAADLRNEPIRSQRRRGRRELPGARPRARRGAGVRALRHPQSFSMGQDCRPVVTVLGKTPISGAVLPLSVRKRHQGVFFSESQGVSLEVDFRWYGSLSDCLLGQYGKPYLWFESISLHHPVAPNWRKNIGQPQIQRRGNVAGRVRTEVGRRVQRRGAARIGFFGVHRSPSRRQRHIGVRRLARPPPVPANRRGSRRHSRSPFCGPLPERTGHANLALDQIGHHLAEDLAYGVTGPATDLLADRFGYWRRVPHRRTGRDSRVRAGHSRRAKGPDADGVAASSPRSSQASPSLALRPAHSRRHLYVTSYTEGFSHFVTSMTAPVASGWSVRRVGLAPTGKRRLLTAHANNGRSTTACRTCDKDSLAAVPGRSRYGGVASGGVVRGPAFIAAHLDEPCRGAVSDCSWAPAR